MAKMGSRFFLVTMWIFTLTRCVPIVSPAESSNCIALGDVSNIPSGSALGSQYSGHYRTLSNVWLNCIQCPSNAIADATCDDTTVDPAHEYEVIQTDGQLIYDDGDLRAVGGVDADGSFTIGATVTPTNNTDVRTGNGFALIEGRFDATGYNATLTLRITVNDPDHTEEVVDLQSVSRIRAERTE